MLANIVTSVRNVLIQKKMKKLNKFNRGNTMKITSHPTGVVKPVYGYPTFPLTVTAV